MATKRATFEVIVDGTPIIEVNQNPLSGYVVEPNFESASVRYRFVMRTVLRRCSRHSLVMNRTYNFARCMDMILKLV